MAATNSSPLAARDLARHFDPAGHERDTERLPASSRRIDMRRWRIAPLRRSADILCRIAVVTDASSPWRATAWWKWLLEALLSAQDRTVSRMCIRVRSEERRVGKECRSRW